jgi:hypothetical protein
MTQAIATQAQPDVQLMESVLLGGDMGKLSAADRLKFYKNVCESLGLNPLTQPFSYIQLNGKLVLYASRNCTDQLRATRKINLSIVARERMEDVYVVTARATMPDGRSDESVGAVALGSLKGEALANALMKAETKAKRRATLSVCGLSWADESEVGSIPNAQTVNVDVNTGEILEATPAPPAGPLNRAVAAAQAQPRTNVTQAQAQQIAGLVAGLGWSPDMVRIAVWDKYQAHRVADLSRENVHDFIDYLILTLATKQAADIMDGIDDDEQEVMEL